MKLAYRDIEPFVNKPFSEARVILVYGPDYGLMQERAKKIGLSIVDDYNDPFNVIALNSDKILEDPARLSDEALSIPMMGGAKLIRVMEAADKLTPLIRDYLGQASDTNLIVLEAAELGPRSTLRTLCEKSKNACAVPCYVEEERDLTQFIQNTLQKENFSIQRDANLWLAENIKGDRLKVRMEIEKIITYKGTDSSPISLQDVQACCGEAGSENLENLIYNVASARHEQALKAYSKLCEEGIPFITILRALQNHFRKLHLTKARLQEGENIDQAMKKLQPPIFFKRADSFKAQVNAKSLKIFTGILQRLSALEASCKQTNAPGQTLCAQAILSLSKSMR